MKAILSTSRISPQKANLVAALVRNKKAVAAVDILKFTPKKAALILKKLIQSAMANAENNFKQNKEDLQIKSIIVTQGTMYKRRNPVSRGRAHPILKKTSHIKVELIQMSETHKGKAAIGENKADEKLETEDVQKKSSTKSTKS